MAILPIPEISSLRLAAVVFVVAVAIMVAAAVRFEAEAEALSAHYDLPPLVQGSVIVAVGSSMPELFSVIVTSVTGQFDLGVGTVVGSAIFNIALIPAISGFVSNWDGPTDRLIIYKEAQFYLLAIAVTFVTFALAVIYSPTSGSSYLAGNLRPVYVALPLALYAIYLFTQVHDTVVADSRASPPGDVLQAWALGIGSLLFILVSVELLVEAVTVFTERYDVQEFLAGAIILAAVTSLPDLIMSVSASRGHRPDTSLGNVLGSNTFDLLVVIPVGVLLTGVVVINFTLAVPMFAILTLITIVLLFMLLVGMSISRREAYLLIGLYLAFVLLVLGEITGVVDLIPTV